MLQTAYGQGNWGRAPKGHIGLQDYGRAIEYRNIKLLPDREKEMMVLVEELNCLPRASNPQSRPLIFVANLKTVPSSAGLRSEATR